jgi:hypothetical protein
MSEDKTEERTGEMLDVENSDVNESVKEGYEEIQPDNCVYLSGPMRKVPEKGKEWRKTVKDKYDELNYIDPYDSFDPEAVDFVPASEFGDGESEVLYSELVKSDKNKICASDYVLVGMSDVIARGTSMEILFSHYQDIPVFVWYRDLDFPDLSPWVVYHSVYCSAQLSDVMETIKKWE